MGELNSLSWNLLLIQTAEHIYHHNCHLYINTIVRKLCYFETTNKYDFKRGSRYRPLLEVVKSSELLLYFVGFFFFFSFPSDAQTNLPKRIA